MSPIRKFLYRSPRFAAECRMDFLHGDSVILGTCSNVSDSGLRGTLAAHVTAGCQGLITLYYKHHKFEVQAEIEFWREDEVRVKFLFRSQDERSGLTAFLKLLAAGQTSRPL